MNYIRFSIYLAPGTEPSKITSALCCVLIVNGTCSICFTFRACKEPLTLPDVKMESVAFIHCHIAHGQDLHCCHFPALVGHTPWYCSAKAQTAEQMNGISADKQCLSWCMICEVLTLTCPLVLQI